MNPINILLILLIIVLLTVLFNPTNRTEKFQPMGAPLHVKLDSDSNAIYISYQSPTANGELGCTQVTCPAKFNNYTCWCCCNY